MQSWLSLAICKKHQKRKRVGGMGSVCWWAVTEAMEDKVWSQGPERSVVHDHTIRNDTDNPRLANANNNFFITNSKV